MKITRKTKLTQRILNAGIAFVLTLSTTSSAMPYIVAQVAAAAGTTVETTDLSTWDLSETRTKGHNALVAGGLHVWTDSNDSQSKAAGYYSSGVNFNLDDASDFNLAWTGSSPAPGGQLVVDLDNDGDLDGILVVESAYGGIGGNIWLSSLWGQSTGSVIDTSSIPHVGGGGSANNGSLADWNASFPNAKVKSIGYSLGSGILGDGVISKITAGGTDYTFALPAYVPTAVPTRPSLSGNVIFDSTPTTLPSNLPSLGFQATQTRAVGDKITFAGSDRALDKVAVTLSSWACQNGDWTSGCVTTPGATFSHPVTLNIYNVAADGTAGSLIASKTQTFAIPYRPTADPTCGSVTQWRDTNGNCFNGLNNVVVFDASGIVVPDSVIYSVAYNTQSYGQAPTNANGPYNSLNVSLSTGAASVGTNANTDEVFWDTTSPGHTVGLKADSGWNADGNPAVTFTAKALAAPTALTWTPDGGTSKPSGTTTNVEKGTLGWSKPDANVDHYKYYFWTNIPGYFNGQANAWSTEDSSYFTNTATAGSIWTNFDGKEGTYNFCVKAVYTTGGQSACSDTFSVTYDKTAPTSTNDLADIVRGTVTVTQTVSDNIAAKSGKLRIWKENADGSLNNSQFFAIGDVNVDGSNKVVYNLNTLTNLFGDGKYVAKFTSTDQAGNASVAQKEFTVDNTAPTITVKDGYVGNLSTKVFSNVSFKLYDQYKVTKYVINGHTSDFTDNQWSDANYQNIKQYLVQGTNIFVLYDIAGNSSTYEFTYDSVARISQHIFSPTNNAIINYNDFWFDWTDVADAVSYETQYSQDPAVGSDGAFTNVAWTGDYQQIQPTDSKAHSVGANGTWYWQVRAIDAAGNKSAWSTPWKLTIDKVAPDAPTLTSPANGVVVNGSSITQSWTDASSDVDHYIYESYNDAGALSLRWHEEFTSTSKTATNVGNATYWWRVKAVDAAGNVSGWSPLWKITVDNDGPVVALGTPSYTATDNVITPSITADDDNGPITYAWTPNNTASADNVDVSDTSVLTPTFTANADGTYAFTLTATDTAGNVTTKVFSFTYTTPVVTLQNNTSTPDTSTGSTNTGTGAGTPSNFTNVALINGGTTTDGTTDVLGAETQNTAKKSGDSQDVLGTTATPEKTSDGQWSLLGLSWYWWLPILVAGGGIAWWFAALARRGSNDA